MSGGGDGAKWLLPRFQKEHNATVTLDVGTQAPRFNKLLSQKAAPVVDVFFSTEELVFNGLKQDLFERRGSTLAWPRWR